MVQIVLKDIIGFLGTTSLLPIHRGGANLATFVKLSVLNNGGDLGLWSELGALYKFLPEESKPSRVGIKDMFHDHNRNWNSCGEVSDAIKNRIISLHIRQLKEEDDLPIWKLTTSKSFNVAVSGTSSDLLDRKDHP
ncbi:hypothetical protein KY285_031431 [Solanum tuberosum]|nr:hypothetical protein KY284_031219 [Solanum tuberosum]KAH0656549.1 hypothetical protein KY285_031431 [Solanum tuberosum]